MKNTKQLLIILCVMASAVAAKADDSSSGSGSDSRPNRACDEYIQKYCTSGGDKGPGCLKGHESDVSAACLQDMQHKGTPPAQGGAH